MALQVVPFQADWTLPIIFLPYDFQFCKRELYLFQTLASIFNIILIETNMRARAIRDLLDTRSERAW